jgi:hypothetical protein
MPGLKPLVSLSFYLWILAAASRTKLIEFEYAFG